MRDWGTAASPWRYRVAADRESSGKLRELLGRLPVYELAEQWSADRSSGSGNHGTGAYTLDGYNELDDRTIGRSPETQWDWPSEDESYKAAYHKNDGATAGYWAYRPAAILSRAMILLILSRKQRHTVRSLSVTPSARLTCATEVGEPENSESPYGTFDQGGNVGSGMKLSLTPGNPTRLAVCVAALSAPTLASIPFTP